MLVAARDRTVRDQLLTQLADLIADGNTLPAAERASLAARLRTRPGYRRILRQTAGELLRIDRAAAAEERVDSKFLLRASDPTLSSEDDAIGYKQLLEGERGSRDMKSTLDLRPVHHLERRIRAHVVLCWLARLLTRLAEQACGNTWPNLRHELDRMHLVTFTDPHGTVRRRTATTARLAAILRALDLANPPRFDSHDITARTAWNPRRPSVHACTAVAGRPPSPQHLTAP